MMSRWPSPSTFSTGQPLGEAVPVQAGRERLGTCLPHQPRPTGGRAAPCSCGADYPDPVGITGGTQLSLLEDLRGDRELRLAEAERRLQACMGGKAALHRVVQLAPWHLSPEMRAVQVPFHPVGGERMNPCPCRPRWWSERYGTGSRRQCCWGSGDGSSGPSPKLTTGWHWRTAWRRLSSKTGREGRWFRQEPWPWNNIHWLPDT